MVRRRERIPLLEGEGLVFELRQHWFTLVWPALLLVATTGIGSFLAGTVPDNGAQATLRLIILGTSAAIVLRWSVWPFLAWYGRSWVLTTRRLIVREGVLSRKGVDVALARVIGSSISRTVLQRMFRSGRLTISTAGPHGNLVIENTPMIAEVAKVVSSAVAHSVPARTPGRSVFPGDPATGAPTPLPPSPAPPGAHPASPPMPPRTSPPMSPPTSQQPFPPQQFRATP